MSDLEVTIGVDPRLPDDEVVGFAVGRAVPVQVTALLELQARAACTKDGWWWWCRIRVQFVVQDGKKKGGVNGSSMGNASVCDGSCNKPMCA